MSDPISASTFSANVAALSIAITDDSGKAATLTILSRTTTPPAVNNLKLFLSPIGKFKMNAVDRRMSCGATPLSETLWTAKYGYYHCPVGQAKFWQKDALISANVMAIRNALWANCMALGVYDLAVSGGEETMVIQWGSGRQTETFLGATLEIRITDYRNL